MKRLITLVASAFLLSACNSGFVDAALTGVCIAAEAGCVKDCQRAFRSGARGASGYDACQASCTSGGNGCAFTN